MHTKTNTTKTNPVLSNILRAMHETGLELSGNWKDNSDQLEPWEGYDFHLLAGRVLRVTAEPGEWEAGIHILLFNNAQSWMVEREMKVTGLTAEGWKLVLKGMTA